MKKRFTIIVALTLATVTPLLAQKKAVTPAGEKPSANWSHGILVGDTLYVSGMAGEDKDGKVPATFDAEAKLAFENIDKVLKTAGMTQANAVSVQVWLTDTALFPAMNKAYTTFFKPPMPTRTTVIVKSLVGPGHIEVTVTARK